MKYQTIIHALVALLFLSACNCKDQPPPPPIPLPCPPHAPPINIEELFAMAQRANSSCSDSFTPAIVAAMAARQQGIPPEALVGILGQGSGDGGGGCRNDVMNFVLAVKTAGGGSYIQQPGVQEWMNASLGSIVGQIGTRLQSQGINPQAAATQLPLREFVSQRVLPMMGPATSEVSQGMGSF